MTSPADQALRLAGKLLEVAATPRPEVSERAKRHIYDYFGVTLAGFSHPSVEKILTLVPGAANLHREELLAALRDDCTLDDAIFAKCVAAHIYDFDDDEPLVSIAHVTAPVMSLVWAAGERMSVSGRRAIAAYVAGVECMIALGRIVNPAHYRYGWHSTTTFGAFGAATAFAVLHGFTPKELATALQFCAAFASGLRTSFGSDAKSIQVARACVNGYAAARMARAGLTASDINLFGPGGFCDLFGGGAARQLEQAHPRFSGTALLDPGLTIKHYPSCTATHTAIDEIKHLVAQFSIDPHSIERIELRVGTDIPKILIYDTPHSPLEGKFCLQFCVAAAAVQGDVGLQTFSQEMIDSPQIRALMARTQVTVMDGDRPTGRLDDAVQATLHFSGRSESCFFEFPTGSPQNPLSPAELDRKFFTCASTFLTLPQAKTLQGRLLDLENISLHQLFEI